MGCVSAKGTHFPSFTIHCPPHLSPPPRSTKASYHRPLRDPGLTALLHAAARDQGLLPPSESWSKVSAEPRPDTPFPQASVHPAPPHVSDLSSHPAPWRGPHHLPKGPLSLRHSRSSLSELLSRFQAIVFASTCLGYSSHYIQAPRGRQEWPLPHRGQPPPGVPGSPRPLSGAGGVLQAGTSSSDSAACQGPRQSPGQWKGGRASSNTQTQGEVTFPSLKADPKSPPWSRLTDHLAVVEFLTQGSGVCDTSLRIGTCRKGGPEVNGR